MIIVVPSATPPGPDVALAGDGNAFHDRQEDDHDCGRCDAHVSDVEDRPVWQLEKVDDMAAEHPWRAEQPVGEISCDTSTQQPDGHGPGGMADPRHQLDDHEEQDRDPRDCEDVGEALALTESSARVPNEPQREQPIEQPNRIQGFQVGYRNDLGDDISRQPGNSDDSDQKVPSPSLDRASAADWAYRRSSRCLHVTHKVARGKACNRPLPMGCPQLSQLP
jgi:hypothetical protein